MTGPEEEAATHRTPRPWDQTPRPWDDDLDEAAEAAWRDAYGDTDEGVTA